jgi:putative peptidoglycan lipid II flippase
MSGLRMGAVLRVAGGLTLLVACGRIMGFGREMLTAQQFGAGRELDSFLLANILPGMVVTALPEALGMAMVPAFVTAIAGGASLWLCVRKYGGRLLLVTLLLSLGLFLFAEPVIRALAQTDYHPTIAHSTNLLRILVITMPLAALVGISAAACNATGRFAVPALHAVFFNFVILSFLILRPDKVNSLAIGLIFGLALQATLQLWFARKSSKGNAPDPDTVQHVFKALMPVLFYSGLVQVNVAIDRTLASGLGIGAISQFNYASVLINLPSSLFAASVATVLLARFALMKAQGESEQAANGLIRSAAATVAITIPVAAITALFCHPIVVAIFGHGKFTAEAAAHTSQALLWLSPTVISVSLLHLAVRYLNSQGRSSDLWGLALAGVIMNFIIKFALIQFMGLNGIAAGTSIATMITALLMLWVAEPTHVKRGIRKVSRSLRWQ